jgi:hypothetical protein
VKLTRVEQFFEELRRSRSRTITLALVRQFSPEAAAASGLGEAVEAAARGGGMAEFVAQHRSRTGLATPQAQLEAYMVTRGSLAARLLKTARGVCPSHQVRPSSASARTRTRTRGGSNTMFVEGVVQCRGPNRPCGCVWMPITGWASPRRTSFQGLMGRCAPLKWISHVLV